MPSHQINKVRYFTALVDSRGDPNRTARQLIYIRALQTIPNLTITYGQFRPRQKNRPLVRPVPGMPTYVDVLDTEEKGSDVNLASYLLLDAFKRDYEQAVVLTSDSDLALPIKMVRDDLGLPVIVVNPNLRPRRDLPLELKSAASEVRNLRPAALHQSQFPPTLVDANGSFRKPASW